MRSNSQTGTTHNGTAVIDGLTDTSGLCVGMKVSGTNVGAAAVINSVDSSTQVTVSVNSTGNGTNTITFKTVANTGYDVYLEDVSGTVKVRMERWSGTGAGSSPPTRALQDGIACRSGTLGRRVVGSFFCHPTTDGQTEDSKVKRYVFQADRMNRVSRAIVKTLTNAAFAGNNNSWGQMVNSSQQVEVFRGFDEEVERLMVRMSITPSTANRKGAIAVGVNSTSAPHGDCIYVHTSASGTTANVHGSLDVSPGLGYFAYTALVTEEGASGSLFAPQYTMANGSPNTFVIGLAGISGEVTQ